MADDNKSDRHGADKQGGKSAGSKIIKMKEEDLVILDLRDKYDDELLARFYNELMIPNFPLQDGVLCSRGVPCYNTTYVSQ